MTNPQKPAAEKIDSSELHPTPAANAAKHEEWVVDEAVDESFPASDPPSTSAPGGSQAVKNQHKEGRETVAPKKP